VGRGELLGGVVWGGGVIGWVLWLCVRTGLGGFGFGLRCRVGRGLGSGCG